MQYAIEHPRVQKIHDLLLFGTQYFAHKRTFSWQVAKEI
jgi:hypothetical protein